MARFQEIKAMNDQRPHHADRENFMGHLKNGLDSSGTDLPEGARSPKARKPYTISKQREKWTEDEHKLFLEALQQHGRGWRRIQEHIGSKTAVQIRSHAQKFFSKGDVIRESSGDSNTIATPPQIQIPPPRPKRRPAHPYPRKLGNSLGKDASTIKQLEKPRLKIQSLSEQENCSPKSVLSTAQIGSETMAIEGSGSPASSVYTEEKCPTPSTSVGELGAQVALSKDAITSNGATCGIPEGPVLRLFGKRVVVNNLQKQQPNSSTENLQHEADMELDALAETPTSGAGTFSSHGAEEIKTWSPWLTGTQQFMYYLPQGEVLSVHPSCQILSYSNGSISYTMLNPQTVVSDKQQHKPSQAADCKFARAEGSWTESNTTSNSVPETTQNSDSIESTQVNNDDDEVIHVPGSRKYFSTAPAYLRGFVPYKKCTAQSKMLQSQVIAAEADGEMTRLCL